MEVAKEARELLKVIVIGKKKKKTQDELGNARGR